MKSAKSSFSAQNNLSLLCREAADAEGLLLTCIQNNQAARKNSIQNAALKITQIGEVVQFLEAGDAAWEGVVVRCCWPAAAPAEAGGFWQKPAACCDPSGAVGGGGVARQKTKDSATAQHRSRQIGLAVREGIKNWSQSSIERKDARPLLGDCESRATTLAGGFYSIKKRIFSQTYPRPILCLLSKHNSQGIWVSCVWKPAEG